MGKNNSQRSTHRSEPRKARVSKSSPKSATNQTPAKPLNSALIETSWRVAMPFLLFVLGGTAIDKTIGTMPVFTMIGLVLAVVSMSIIVYRYVNEHFPETFEKDDK